jgi:hypothetical protein
MMRMMLIERFISAIVINSIVVHWRIPGVVGYYLTMLFLLLLLIHHEDRSIVIVIVIVQVRIRVVVIIIVHHDPGPNFRLAGASQGFSLGHEKGWW